MEESIDRIDMTGWLDAEIEAAAELGNADIARSIDLLPRHLKSGDYSVNARTVVQLSLGWI